MRRRKPVAAGEDESVLSRAYGLGIDNVLEFTMVTVNGSSVVKASAAVNTALFWALRGGGAPNFGVVTDITLRLVASNATAFSFGEYCPTAGQSDMTGNLTLYNNGLSTVPDWLYVMARFKKDLWSPTAPIETNGLCFIYYSRRDANSTLQALDALLGHVSSDSRLTRVVPTDAAAHTGNFIGQYKSQYEMVIANAIFKNYMPSSVPFKTPFYNRGCIFEKASSALAGELVEMWTKMPDRKSVV